MTMVAAASSTRLDNSYLAGQTVAARALASLHGELPRLVIAFITDRYDKGQVTKGIRSVMGDAALIGCSAAGVINSTESDSDGIGIMVISSDTLKVDLALGSGISHQPLVALEEIASQIEDHLPSPSSGQNAVGLVFPDGVVGLTTIDTLLKDLATMLGPFCPLVGGGAGDDMQMAHSSQFINDQVHSDSMIVALLTMPNPIGIGVAHSWKPISHGLVVTRSEQNIVYELDGIPALDAYRDIFPTEQLDVENFHLFGLTHPLGVAQSRGEYLIRVPVGVLSNGAIVCGGNIAENSVAHIMESTPAALIDAAHHAAQQAMGQLRGTPAAATLVFSCVTRPLILGNSIASEIATIREVVGHHTPLSGMFSFGEIATQKGFPLIHNVTVVVFVIGQDEGVVTQCSKQR